MYTVYVIKSQSGLLYIGHTDNLARRLNQHQKGQARYTKRDSGWTLVYAEEFETRAEAMRREKWLKSGTGRKWLKNALGS